MRIFRIETPSGVGPYRYGAEKLFFVPPWLDRVGDLMAEDWDIEDVLRPLPDEDGLYGMRADEVCAFESMASLLSWFPREVLSIMAEYDFHVKVYDAPERAVRVGRRQVLADRTTLVPVKSVHCAVAETVVE